MKSLNKNKNLKLKFYNSAIEDILFVDKPKGISSFDVIRILRKKLNIKKMGHAGTLDPLASGLLIIGVNSGTKKLNQFLNLDKTYLMEILLGKQTQTGDMEGEIIAEKKVSKILISEVKKVLQEMKGKIELAVPIYSAIKIDGKKLYEYARQKVKIKTPQRENEIFYLKLLDYFKEKENYILKVEMRCSKGTYARSVGEEIGRRLGYPATLKNLRRLKIGDFEIKKSRRAGLKEN
ncbi:MAG: tRNA pseudouridine(55) synthase TruB [Patescibacteria group bacterium]|nr:tRNA pseudouridine(55) synthase TruB [Patescibacteria group bacterium]